ncbi:hypothetical protein ACMGDH_14500 [Sphingomonas sp. DT-207]|uniref:hypothetical protein n=1 Tax=Sphingomonas sp. DT-207 TaxID=3396167 RepID=UPI003F1D7593
MAHGYSNFGPKAQDRAYRVERPRASDAVAAALRDAFDEEPEMPADMMALLHRLNGAGGHAAC